MQIMLDPQKDKQQNYDKLGVQTFLPTHLSTDQGSILESCYLTLGANPFKHDEKHSRPS